MQTQFDELLAARAVMLNWLAHVEDHFPIYNRSLGISDAMMEEVLILEELQELGYDVARLH